MNSSSKVFDTGGGAAVEAAAGLFCSLLVSLAVGGLLNMLYSPCFAAGPDPPGLAGISLCSIPAVL